MWVKKGTSGEWNYAGWKCRICRRWFDFERFLRVRTCAEPRIDIQQKRVDGWTVRFCYHRINWWLELNSSGIRACIRMRYIPFKWNRPFESVPACVFIGILLNSFSIFLYIFGFIKRKIWMEAVATDICLFIFEYFFPNLCFHLRVEQNS